MRSLGATHGDQFRSVSGRSYFKKRKGEQVSSYHRDGGCDRGSSIEDQSSACVFPPSDFRQPGMVTCDEQGNHRALHAHGTSARSDIAQFQLLAHLSPPPKKSPPASRQWPTFNRAATCRPPSPARRGRCSRQSSLTC